MTARPIGASLPRLELPRLLRGGGRYVGDIVLPRMLHLAFCRSPYPFAEILSINTGTARQMPGVRAVFTGEDLRDDAVPFVGVAMHRKGHRSAKQYLLAVSRAVWQGQPVVAVVAETRAQAEDAAEHIEIAWRELTPLVRAEDAVSPGAATIHPELPSNVSFSHDIEAGDPKAAFDAAHMVVEATFRFERQTGLTLEPRGLVARFDPTDGSLTVWHSHQSPFQMQDVFSQHLGIPEQKVRVIAPDVGGGFGLKVNVYAEEVAVAAISRRLGRAVSFCADRVESFLADAHAREHVIHARLATDMDGRFLAMSLDDIGAIGAYGMAMRFNIAEGLMAIMSAGAPYALEHYSARTRSVFVNKNLIGMYRGVGIPLGCVVTEQLVDFAARRLGIDPVEIRRRNHHPPSTLPRTLVSGYKIERLSFDACLDRLVPLMGYDRLRAEQENLRARGVYRGVGIASFIEPTAYGPPYYGPSEARISVQDGCSVRLEPSGAIRCLTSITDQGQGTLTGIAQIIADEIGVPIASVSVAGGDSAHAPYGGGAWASRGMAIGGEAALKAARDLRRNLLELAATISQAVPAQLDIVDGVVINRDTGADVISLGELGRIGYFRQDTLPASIDPQLAVSRSHVAPQQPYYMANGVQACHVEVDVETGFIRLLGHWAVDDCGRVINPLQVQEQVRGSIVQGIGAVLFEELSYSPEGYLLNGTLADYLAPMASEMPDIVVDHIETPEPSTELGAKGVGEAGLIGAMGAVWVAVNDALAPLGARILQQPFTPQRVLDAIDDAKM